LHPTGTDFCKEKSVLPKPAVLWTSSRFFFSVVQFVLAKSFLVLSILFLTISSW